MFSDPYDRWLTSDWDYERFHGLDQAPEDEDAETTYEEGGQSIVDLILFGGRDE